MILEKTVDYLLSIHDERIKSLTIAEVRIGLHLTAVRLSDGSCGVASTIEDDQYHCTKKNRDFGDFTPTRFRGRTIADLFLSKKQTNIVNSLKVAVLNAISTSLLSSGKYRVLENTDPIDLLDLKAGKTITVVGAFLSYIEKISGSGNRLHVVEFNENCLGETYRNYYVPAAEYARVVPRSDVVIITGMTLVNNSIDGLLSAVTPGTQVIVTGPSSSLIPDVLFRHGVTMVGATRIHDPELLFGVVGEGGAGYHLFRYCAQKICILNDTSR